MKLPDGKVLMVDAGELDEEWLTDNFIDYEGEEVVGRGMGLGGVAGSYLKKPLVVLEDFFGWDTLFLTQDNKLFLEDRNCGMCSISPKPLTDQEVEEFLDGLEGKVVDAADYYTLEKFDQDVEMDDKEY